MFTHLRTGLALACAGVLVSVPALVTTSASAVQAEQQAGQSLIITVAKGSLKLKGTSGLRAGRVKLTVKGQPAPVTIMSLAKGYTLRELSTDYKAANKGDMKALKRAVANTTWYGGLSSGSTGTVVLPRAGTYIAAVMANKVMGPTTFEVGAVKKSGTPSVDGTITARKGMKWGGADHLPTKGTLRFKNSDTQPHFLSMVQVEEGTTIDDVMDGLQSEEEPAWVLSGGAHTDVLSPGRQMTMDYDVPAGQYVLLCFFPDPKMKGMPHSMMGMVKMIHVM
ncbi:hypothetical protein EXE58_14415 [Nocardioides seonyuensis]|uniref:Blue (type 1) copper domain-containing protein n=1 Tax=Nocardioides seonyuensis TaxID=2518371 RepID=A0A4P7IIL2_9ACTN|nr:hypothetical protein [Nocardioides seonyuensis]QBX56540.1 hypothetical protein EXE58_14415 [Nocardioides seonyuensis]